MTITLPPLGVNIAVIALTSASAHRVADVTLGLKRTAEVTFTFDEVSREGSRFEVVSSYEVHLHNEEGEDAAQTSTTVAVDFSIDEELPENLQWHDAARVQLAGAEAAHAYHRDMILQLTQAMNLIPYRLAFTFARDKFLAQIDQQPSQYAANKPTAPPTHGE